MFTDSDRVRCFIYNKEGRCSPAIYISCDSMQIASFIMKKKESPKIIITDISDNFKTNTLYGYIDKCIDEDYLDELLEVLIPIQEGKLEPQELAVLSWGVSEEFNNDNIIIQY